VCWNQEGQQYEGYAGYPSPYPQRHVHVQVIPSDCRRAATEAFTFTIIVDGGEVPIIQGFDTILHEGEAVPCIGLEPRSERNPFANLLWLQALVREQGIKIEPRRKHKLMSGTLHIIPSSASALHRIELLDKPPSVARPQRAVGGEIVLIPGFDTILRDGEVEPCVASYYETDFC